MDKVQKHNSFNTETFGYTLIYKFEAGLVHTGSYTMGTAGSFSGVKAAVA
jgi:hypothetical protein